MNSWVQQQNQNTSFNPYNNNVPYNFQPQMQMYGRLPVYRADPIHGENAAWQFQMGPNSEIYLPDADKDIMWWIRTDANGNKNVIALDVMPHKKEPQIDVNDLATRLAAVEEWINGKQNKSNAKRSTTVSTNTTGSVESIN